MKHKQFISIKTDLEKHSWIFLRKMLKIGAFRGFCIVSHKDVYGPLRRYGITKEEFERHRTVEWLST
ncbi:MAG: hypothetical protein ACP5RX_02615, partial [Minisyncoccia bacterium]